MAAVDTCTILERKVRRRIHDDDAHRRVAEALADVARDVLHPARHRGLTSTPPAILEHPVEAATQAALTALEDKLEDLLELLSLDRLEELNREQIVAELGLE